MMSTHTKRRAPNEAAVEEPKMLGRRGERLGVAGLVVVAVLATLVATRHGPGLSPDSVTYISIARNLANGRGFFDFTGRANTTFPPAFPALLAVGLRLGLTSLDAARIVNAGSFGAIVVFAWMLLRRHTGSRRVAFVATAFIAASPAVLNVADEVWSEPLFCALALGFLLVLEDVLIGEGGDRRTVLAGLLAGTAFCVRYAALALIVLGVALVLFGIRNMTVRARIRRALVFAVAAAPLPLIWILRNVSTDNPYVLGPRVASRVSPWSLTQLLLKGLGELFVPRTLFVAWALIAGPLTIVAVVGAAAWIRNSGAARVRHSSTRPVTVLVAFIGVYNGFLLVAGRTTGASVDSRTVMPVYVPALILGACAIEAVVPRSTREALATRPSSYLNRYAGRLVMPLVLCSLAFYAAWFAQVSIADGATARGYATAASARSELGGAVQRLGSRAVIATNRPWTLYAATRHQPIMPDPGPLVPAASLVPATIDELDDATCTHAVYLAWYGSSSRRSKPSPRLSLHPVLRFSDGALYELRPRHETCRRPLDDQKRGDGSRDPTSRAPRSLHELRE